MKEPISKYFRMGTILWMSYPPERYDQIDAALKIARDPFFDAIEVTHLGNMEQMNKLGDIIAQSHMKVCYGAQPRLLGKKLNPNAIDESERLKAEIELKEAIDEAENLGAKGIAFLAGKWEQNTKEEAYKQLLKTTYNICEYAKAKSMNIELEVFDYDMDKAALIGPAPLAQKFAADIRMRYNNFGLLVDLSHFPTTYETSDFVISLLKPYITHLHIGNAVVKQGCEAYGDQHPRFGFPNSANDTEELLDFFRSLKENGLLNDKCPMVLSFEVKPWKDEDADIIVANTRRVIDRAWALLED